MVKGMIRRLHFLLPAAAIAIGVFVAGHSFAQSAPEKQKPSVVGTVFDCADVTVDYQNDPSLTHDENLALMDKALYQSLSKFDACQEARENANNSSGGAGTAGGASGSQNGGGSSVATNDMSGSENSQSKEGASTEITGSNELTGSNEITGSAVTPSIDQSEQSSSQKDGGGGSQKADMSNGKMPEDIPPADNDSVLEAQIRQAAINETDPIIKAKLWNEYRKYKGLPAVQ